MAPRATSPPGAGSLLPISITHACTPARPRCTHGSSAYARITPVRGLHFTSRRKEEEKWRKRKLCRARCERLSARGGGGGTERRATTTRLARGTPSSLAAGSTTMALMAAHCSRPEHTRRQARECVRRPEDESGFRRRG